LRDAKVRDFNDLSGQVFGRLTVLHRVANRHAGNARFACICSCGAQHEANGQSLKRRMVQSCGCLQRETPWRHGLTSHPLYHCWYNMVDRCYDTTNKQYAGYGGRGIAVCDEWRGPNGLAQFVADMVARPPGHSIERIDNDGPYCKLNCRWATRKEQQRNMRVTRIITHSGQSGTIGDWAQWLGISSGTIWYRLKTGQSLDAALSPKKFASYRGKATKSSPGD
jgi:hypothetical protein